MKTGIEMETKLWMSIGVRVIFCQGVGAVDHLPKNSRKLPKFLRNSRKETKVI